MRENKAKISLVTVICIFMIIVMACAIVYLCVIFSNTKVEDEKTINSLNDNLKTVQESNQKLQGTVNELQEKIDTVKDTLNTENTSSKNDESSSKDNASSSPKKLSESEQKTIFKEALCEEGKGSPFVSDLMEFKNLSDGDVICLFWSMDIKEKEYLKQTEAPAGYVKVISNDHLKEIAKKYFNKEIDIEKAIKESHDYCLKYSDTEVSICGNTGYGISTVNMISVENTKDNQYEIKFKYSEDNESNEYTLTVNKVDDYYQYISIK